MARQNSYTTSKLQALAEEAELYFTEGAPRHSQKPSMTVDHRNQVVVIAGDSSHFTGALKKALHREHVSYTDHGRQNQIELSMKDAVTHLDKVLERTLKHKQKIPEGRAV